MKKKMIVFFVFLFLIASVLQAGGWNNTLMGSRALAIGGAFAGIADDPSAVYYNPAGLVFQRENLNVSIVGFYIWPTHEFVTPSRKAQSKYNSSIPQIFLTYRMNEKVTLGFGAYVPYAGGGVDWKENQLGFPFKSYLGVLCLSPTIAYQVSDKLSLGFNLNFYHALLEVDAEMVDFGPFDSEESGTAISAGFGLMFKPNDRLRFGIGVRGPAKMKMSGKTAISTTFSEFEQIKLKFDSETRFNIPWDIEVGVSYKITDNFLISSSAQYTMWSTLDKVEKTIKNIPTVGDLKDYEELHFKDILILRAGFEYVVSQGLALRAGVGMDRYATPAEYLDFKNIDVDKFTLLGGIGYRAGRVQIDFVYAYAAGKEREKQTTQQGFPLTEKYNLNAAILGLGVTFSF